MAYMSRASFMYSTKHRPFIVQRLEPKLQMTIAYRSKNECQAIANNHNEENAFEMIVD